MHLPTIAVSMQVIYKAWLDDDGMAFGERVHRLLKGIEETGSLRKAALAMNLTYKRSPHH